MNSDTISAETPPRQPQTVAARLPFHEELQARVTTFVKETLTAIPELESLAVIPAWTVPQDRLPHGYLRGQHGGLAHPGEVMHMALQLHAVLYDVLGLSLESIRVIDAEMQRMAQEIKKNPNVADDRTPPTPIGSPGD